MYIFKIMLIYLFVDFAGILASWHDMAFVKEGSLDFGLYFPLIFVACV